MDTFPIPPPAFSGRCRAVPPGNIFDWLRQGWAVFMVNPGAWIAMTVLFAVIFFGLSIVPLIGRFAAFLLSPLLTAGLLAACRRIERGETPEIPDLFTGFRVATSNLVMLGLALAVAMLAIFVLVTLLGGGSLAGGLMMGTPSGFGFAFAGMLLALLLSLVLTVPVAMALCFAPALVLFNDMAPLPALRASFDACLTNALPFLVFGLIVLVLGFFAALPLGLGFLILMPVLAGALHAAYRDVFPGS